MSWILILIFYGHSANVELKLTTREQCEWIGHGIISQNPYVIKEAYCEQRKEK
jgi:hypothetical protein